MGSGKLIFVTGLSGAGMSSALKSLEDLDYEVLDNFPLSLLETLLNDKKHKNNNIAIGIDSRTRHFTPTKLIKAVKEFDASLIFITCDDAILQKRFTETRRKHPLAKDRSISDGILKERRLLESVQKKSDLLIDTSDLSIHDLRHIIKGNFTPERKKNLNVTLMSFGFRNGLPREADIVMDVRFLRNPHWDKALKPLTGQNEAVGAYIAEDQAFEGFIDNFKGLIEPLLDRYVQEGKSYLTIAIGCTGGKHRSVYSVEVLKLWFKKMGVAPHIVHRDMPI